MTIAVLLTPVTTLVSSLCSVDDWSYMKKKRFDGSVANIAAHAHTHTQNIIVFPKNTPFHAKPVGDWRCKRCGSDKFVVRQENRICCFCGESAYYESEPAVALASTTSRAYNTNSNKRLAHFKNWILRLQGKERCSISTQDLDRVSALVAGYPDNLSDHEKIRTALKELGLQRYYNHVYYVMRHVLGYPLVEFRKLNEARLVAMFMRIQEPFAKMQQGRTNMISYQFLIRKFCELLGYSLAKYIPLLKSRSNLQRQDYIWKCICDELALPFYPSV